MRLVLLALAITISALSFGWPGAQARADQGDIEVTSLSAESHYPNGMTFHVSARSSAEIDEVRVYFRKTGRVTAGAYREVEFQTTSPDSTGSIPGGSNSGGSIPGYSISGEAILVTGLGGGYIPPGTEITYSFEIRDESGSVYRTPDQVAVYNNSSFAWESLTSGSITVLHYGAGSREKAQLVLEAAAESLKRMAPVLGFDPSEPVRIVAYRGPLDLLQALPLRMQAMQGQVQTEGMAFADERVVLIDGFNPNYRGITSHEITHLEVAEVTGRAHNRVPGWLSEGLAEYGNIDPTTEYTLALNRGIRRDRLSPLSQLRFSSGSGEDIVRAYGQGLSVVEYLVDNFGESKVAELMAEIQGSLDIDEALEAVYGFNQYGLDTAWRLSNGLDPFPEPEERSSIRDLLPTITPSPAPPPTKTPTVVPTAEPILAPTSTATPLPTATATALPPVINPSPQAPVGDSVPGEDSHGGDSGETPISPGCYSPRAGNYGAFSGDLSFLAILGLPLAMLAIRHRPRR